MDNQFVGGPPSGQVPPQPYQPEHQELPEQKPAEPVEPVYSPNHVVTSPKKYSRNLFRKFLKLVLVLILMAGSAYAGYMYEKNKATTDENSKNQQISDLNAQVKKLRANSTSSATTKVTNDAQVQTIDAFAVQQGVILYKSANSDAVPQTLSAGKNGDLKICGSSCTATAQTVTLSRYDPANVSIKAYQANLTAPDSQNIFIITAASCDKNTLISKSNSEAIYYSVTTSSNKTQQNCIVV